MNSLNTKWIAAALMGGACLLIPGTAQAVTIPLRAATTSLTMADGQVVPMWGFARDTVWGTPNGLVSTPGPAIVIPPTDPQLRIILDNRLPEGVSLVIPGLPPPEVHRGSAAGPLLTGHSRFTPIEDVDNPPLADPTADPPIVFPGPEDVDGNGNGIVDGRSRARSFVPETPPQNSFPDAPGVRTQVWYIWNNVPPGTYLYHSGSHAALQVQMGLVGKVEKTAAANQIYPGVAFNSAVTLLFTEIDPVIHNAVEAGQYGPGLQVSSLIDSIAKYRLVNGKPYLPNQPLLGAGLPSQTCALRMLNGGYNALSLVVEDNDLSVIAENAKPYTYAKALCSVPVPPLSTADALLTPAKAGTFTVYDRRFGGLAGDLGVRQVFPSAAGQITIPAAGTSGNSAPYPSTINVSGLEGNVRAVTVTFTGLSHQRPQDIDAMLVHNGVKIVLMSDVGGNIPLTPAAAVNLTFDDQAAGVLSAAQVRTGTYRPTNLGAGDPFPGTPAGPVSTTLSAFTTTEANGDWSLFVVDDAAGQTGGINTTGRILSWSLNITPAGNN